VLRIAFQSVPAHQKQKQFSGATKNKYILQVMVLRVLYRLGEEHATLILRAGGIMFLRNVGV
jgi:hypothetical protein